MVNEKPLERTRAELEKLLVTELDFLQRSADAFDNGFEDEAIRLAVPIRVLVHDTPKSKSLLGQLNMKNIKYYDSASEYDPRNILGHHGLVGLSISNLGPRYISFLDDVPRVLKLVTFTEWWGKIVFADKEKRIFSRKDLVLAAANQEGGAHVDPLLNEMYFKISQEGALGWMIVGPTGERPLEWAERSSIRQIAHEVLKTLIPGYKKRRIL